MAYKDLSTEELKKKYNITLRKTGMHGLSGMLNEYSAKLRDARSKEAMLKGLSQGKEEYAEHSPDIDIKKEKADLLTEAKAEETKSLTAAEYAPIHQRIRTQTRTMRGATAGQGIRGATAGQMMANAYQEGRNRSAATGAALMEDRRRRTGGIIAAHEMTTTSLPIAYANLFSGRDAEQREMELSSRGAPRQNSGWFSKLFS